MTPTNPGDIPQDQLERIRPVLERLLAHLRTLTATLPRDADSALTYQPDEDAL